MIQYGAADCIVELRQVELRRFEEHVFSVLHRHLEVIRLVGDGVFETGEHFQAA